ncbi:MAG: hypothetical protein AAGA26_02990, partial [Pseudomonadota bacterium]
TRRQDVQWVAFDSFADYPRDGRIDWQVEGIQKVPADLPGNVKLIEGFFANTLPEYLASNPGPVSFVDICSDVYSSASDVFSTLEFHGQMRPGLPVLFNQIVNCPDSPWNEMRAFYEMLERTGLGFEWHARRDEVWQAEDMFDLIEIDCYPEMDELRAAGYSSRASVMLTGRGIDYGPLHESGYQHRVQETARAFEKASSQRQDRYYRSLARGRVHATQQSLLKHVQAAQSRNFSDFENRRKIAEDLVRSKADRLQLRKQDANG